MRLYSTRSREKEELPPAPGPIRMYFCGPTVYQRIHVGNAIPFVLPMWLKHWLDLQDYETKLVINITDSFVNSFGIVDITTAGGPARATDLMVYKIYSDGFQGKDYSLAAAQSIVLMGLIVALTFIQFRFIERRVHYS
jgi:hypothetical protein